MIMLKYSYLFLLFILYSIGISYGIIVGKDSVIIDVPTNDNPLFDIESFLNLGYLQRVYEIAHNNLVVALQCLFFNIFTVGIYSVLHSLYNSFIIGLFLGEALTKVTVLDLLLKFLSYGLTELMGIWLLAYSGFLISIKFFFGRRFFSKKRILYFILVGIFLIIESAFIENLCIQK